MKILKREVRNNHATTNPLGSGATFDLNRLSTGISLDKSGPLVLEKKKHGMFTDNIPPHSQNLPHLS